MPLRVSPGQVGELTAVVTRLRRALRRSVRSTYPWEVLPVAQVELLQALQELGTARIGHVAAFLQLAPNTVSMLAQQLVEAGLVTRDLDRRDRRAAVLALTDAGRARLDGWDAAHEQRLADALSVLTVSDQTAISRALPALGRLVEQLTGQVDQESEPDRPGTAR